MKVRNFLVSGLLLSTAVLTGCQFAAGAATGAATAGPLAYLLGRNQASEPVRPANQLAKAPELSGNELPVFKSKEDGWVVQAPDGTWVRRSDPRIMTEAPTQEQIDTAKAEKAKRDTEAQASAAKP